MPTKPSGTQLLTGTAAGLAAIPLDPSIRGGLDGGFRGVLDATKSGLVKTEVADAFGQGEPEDNQFAGLGPWLEGEDADVFKSVDGMVLRQEIIALNHLAQDTHWTYVKLGYPWSTLTKEVGRDRYTQSLPYGSAGITIQAVPNKAWDLITKTKEALLVDFPQVEAEPGTDSERAQAATEAATRFLTLDAGEQGTNDAVLFGDRVERALTCASSYLECWTDPTGGGYVPLQIPAHPQAVSPMQPMLGPDGMPTTSPILRYVTSVGPDGQPTEESQFTEDATKAAPQWQPKLIGQKWQREHMRVYPETKPVEQAEKVIILGYCTLGEGKRRWKTVAEMDPDDLTKLTDWTPTRYLALLPLFQRGRWKLTDGRDKEKQGASDERIMFYYHPFVKACPDYRKGADIVVTGAFGGKILERKLLSVEVEVPADAVDAQGQPTDNPEGAATKKETRCMEIPVVQVTPRQDPDEQDPSGRAYIELFAGAVENNAHLAMSASEVIDKNLHLEAYSTSTSPIDGQQREESRATGRIVPLLRPEDMPKWGEPIRFEQAFFSFYDRADQAIDSIGSANKAAKGQEGADEKSGRAIALATANNNVSLGGMNQAINNAYCRWNRIKLERMMADYTTAQQINYVGDDGIFKQEELSAMDFALVGKMTIKAGTGGLVNPDQKVQNLAGLAAGGLLSPAEAKEAARPAFSRKLGLPASAAEQRIERQITTFLKGPPAGQPATLAPDGVTEIPGKTWVQKWQEYEPLKAQYDAAVQQEQTANASLVAAGQPAPPSQLQPPPTPWTPFTPLPTDDEPETAQLRRRRLSKLINSAKFEGMLREWQAVALTEYARMRQIESAAAAAQAQAQQPQQPAGQAPKPSSQPTAVPASKPPLGAAV